ncbi:hypothetical protein HK100_012446 [Physocladia obscura]|uniref:BZIP domain-containing protein n=1 Tax=Physocladia obscura TaxID=109957 RepID=A0AAD5T0P8_9FUNG|nr:hypothetical protein HK100_012446 [Physocladia obscura]
MEHKQEKQQQQQQQSGFSESSNSPQSSAVETDSGNGRRQESPDNRTNSNITTSGTTSTSRTNIDRDKLKSREAQRALRERKAKYIHNLEAKVKELETLNSALRARVREKRASTAASAQQNAHPLLYNHSHHNLTAASVLPAAPVVPSSSAFPWVINSHLHSLSSNNHNDSSSKKTNSCSVCIVTREIASINAARIPVLKSLIANARSCQANNPNQNQSQNHMNTFHNSNIQSSIPLYKSAHDLYGPLEVECFRISCKNIPSLKDHTIHIDAIFDILQVAPKKKAKR